MVGMLLHGDGALLILHSLAASLSSAKPPPPPCPALLSSPCPRSSHPSPSPPSSGKLKSMADWRSSIALSEHQPPHLPHAENPIRVPHSTQELNPTPSNSSQSPYGVGVLPDGAAAWESEIREDAGHERNSSDLKASPNPKPSSTDCSQLGNSTIVELGGAAMQNFELRKEADDAGKSSHPNPSLNPDPSLTVYRQFVNGVEVPPGAAPAQSFKPHEGSEGAEKSSKPNLSPSPDPSLTASKELANAMKAQPVGSEVQKSETRDEAKHDRKSLQQGKCKEVLQLFKSRKTDEALGLLESMNEVDEYVAATYEQMLLYCGKFRIVGVARKLDALALRHGFISNLSIGNAFISTFSSLGMLSDAQRVFNIMPVRNSTSWTELLIGYVRYSSHEEARKVYERMTVGGIELGEAGIVLMLNSCGTNRDIHLGKELQADAIKRGLDGNVYVKTAFINMYTKIDDLKTAYEIFKGMPERSAVSWHVMIYAYAKSGKGGEALELYQQMKKEGVKPSDSTFVALLKICETLADIELGKQIHADIAEGGINITVYLGTALVNMYAKCGNLETAQEILDKMPIRNEVSFSAMIAGYRKKNKNKEVIRCYMQMRREGFRPHPRTIISVIHACSLTQAIEEGRQVHADVIKLRFGSDASVMTALVDMYCKYRQLDVARELFDSMTQRTEASYSSMISAYAKNYTSEEALRLYDQMKKDGIRPETMTFVFVLNACATTRNLELGRMTHAEITKAGLESKVTVGSALVDMYSKCGSMAEAQEVFERLPFKNECTWTSLIAGYATNKSFEEAFDLYRAMKLQGLKPDAWTFACVLNVCAEIESLEYGKEVHEDIRRGGYEADSGVSKALAQMYSKCNGQDNSEFQVVS